MALAEEEALGEEAGSPEIRQRRKDHWEEQSGDGGLEKEGVRGEEITS